jgi:hypothetical protein
VAVKKQKKVLHGSSRVAPSRDEPKPGSSRVGFLLKQQLHRYQRREGSEELQEKVAQSARCNLGRTGTYVIIFMRNWLVAPLLISHKINLNILRFYPHCPDNNLKSRK